MGLAFIVFVFLLGAGVLAAHRYPRLVLAAMRVTLRRACGLTRREIIVDGLRWVYLDSGGRGRPVITLLHGFGADKDNWSVYARELRARFRIIAPDLPGFGESTQDPDLAYTAEAQTARLDRFLAALNLQEVHLAGNSLGGFLAACYALAHPAKVRSLTLIDAAGLNGPDKSEFDLIIDRGENPFIIDSFARFEALMNRIAHRPPPLPGFVKRALYAEMRQREPFLNRQFWELLRDMQSRNLLAQVSRLAMPTLVIWGREDRLVDVSSARAIHALVAHSELWVLDQVGHVPMIEAPRRTARRHADFIATLGAAAVAAAA